MMSTTDFNRPIQGVGLGLRPTHIHEVLNMLPDVRWFEVHICNYLGGGLSRYLLEQVRAHYPLSFHGVNLNLGGVDPLDSDYLQRLKSAVNQLQPDLISDHACFTAHRGHVYHDLLPIPFTQSAVTHLVSRIQQVQDTLGRQILIENISQYVQLPESEMTELEFLYAVAEQSQCGLILDLNNLYVNQCNLSVSLSEYFQQLDDTLVQEIHLGGHSVQPNGQLIDTHSAPVCEAVWSLYAEALAYYPEVPCLIEWDNELPPFTRLLEEAEKAHQLHQQILKPRCVT